MAQQKNSRNPNLTIQTNPSSFQAETQKALERKIEAEQANKAYAEGVKVGMVRPISPADESKNKGKSSSEEAKADSTTDTHRTFVPRTCG